MITAAELDTAVRARIAALPAAFPYALSVAGPSDDSDILALAIKHSAGQPNACDWAPIIAGGTAAIAVLRLDRVTVLLRDKTGAHQLRAVISFSPDAPAHCWLTAIAVDATRSMPIQLKYVWAILLPVFRALVPYGYTRLLTLNFPLDNRMKAFSNPMRTQLFMTVTEHRLDETGNVTHAAFDLDIIACLAKFEAMF